MRYESRRKRRIRQERAARTKQRKAFARLSFLCLSLVMITAMSVNLITTVFAKDTASYESVTVTYGDTLWDIAKKYNTDNKDIRVIVDRIMRANDMTSTKLCVGDTINIPLY